MVDYVAHMEGAVARFRSNRDSSPVPLADLRLKEILRLQGELVEELRDRDVIRTRNVVGELAETIVARAYRGEPGAPSQSGWDVRVGDRKLQVKCRVVQEGEKRTQQFTPFAIDELEADEADAFVFVILDARTYEIARALEIPRDDVVAMSSPVPRSSKRRVNARQVTACKTAVDVTESLARAYSDMDTPRRRARGDGQH